MTSVMFLCNLVLKLNLNKIIFKYCCLVFLYCRYRAFIFSLTFFLYASFHLSRKPISIVKGELHKHCAASHEVEPDSYKEYAAQIQPVKKPSNVSQCGWEPFGKRLYASCYFFLVCGGIQEVRRYVWEACFVFRVLTDFSKES